MRSTQRQDTKFFTRLLIAEAEDEISTQLIPGSAKIADHDHDIIEISNEELIEVKAS